MPRSPWSLIRAARPPDADPVPDAVLLARFARDGDQAAFELLVWRHGRLVLGVARRVLADPHAAEDVFQATFLVLARKAGTVRGSLPGWLHRVARRVAVRAARRTRPTVGLAFDPPARPDDAPDPALRAVLDEEIDRLSDRLRLPVVLCYLDGRTTEDAAGVLGVPRGTVLSRLAAARAKLQARLTRRGVAAPVGVAAVAGDLTADGVRATVAAAVAFLRPAGIGSAGPAGQLAQEFLRMSTQKVVAGMALAVGLTAGLGAGAGVGAWADEAPAPQPGPAPAAVAQAAPPTPPAAEPPKSPAERRIEDLSRRREEFAETYSAFVAEAEKRVERSRARAVDAAAESAIVTARYDLERQIAMERFRQAVATERQAWLAVSTAGSEKALQARVQEMEERFKAATVNRADVLAARADLEKLQAVVEMHRKAADDLERAQVVLQKLDATMLLGVTKARQDAAIAQRELDDAEQHRRETANEMLAGMRAMELRLRTSGVPDAAEPRNPSSEAGPGLDARLDALERKLDRLLAEVRELRKQ